jgi:hypothetical protein
MRTLRAAPTGYVEFGRLDLDEHTKRRLIGLSVGWSVVSLVGVCAVASGLRTIEIVITPEQLESFQVWGFLAGALAATVGAGVGTILAHEAVHGALLWWLTGDRPTFGFKGWYAYAAAPGWYFARDWFLLVALAPAVVVTAVSLALFAVLPLVPALVMLVVAYTNLLGSIGDLYISWLVIRLPRSTIIEDRPEGVAWHRPGPDHIPAAGHN